LGAKTGIGGANVSMRIPVPVVREAEAVVVVLVVEVVALEDEVVEEAVVEDAVVVDRELVGLVGEAVVVVKDDVLVPESDERPKYAAPATATIAMTMTAATTLETAVRAALMGILGCLTGFKTSMPKRHITIRLRSQNMEKPKGQTSLKTIAYVALVLGVVANLIGFATFLRVQNLYLEVQTGQSQTLQSITVNGAIITPPMTAAPVIQQEQPFGHRLTGINSPLNSTELATINNAPDSYFQTAGEMFLNNSLSNVVNGRAYVATNLIVNGKPSVIYLGAISCIYCGENRWAMALALGKFGSFDKLFTGYSALLDGDVPTLYWAPVNYNATTGVLFGNFYNSSVINFLSIEYLSPISGGFSMGTLPYFLQQAQSSATAPYVQAMNVLIGTNDYQGTPDTQWGKFSIPQADAADFGNSATSANNITLTYMTHAQVLQQISKPANQFAWTEYAAADIYIAATCTTLQNVPHVCQIPAIRQIQAGLAFA